MFGLFKRTRKEEVENKDKVYLQDIMKGQRFYIDKLENEEISKYLPDDIIGIKFPSKNSLYPSDIELRLYYVNMLSDKRTLIAAWNYSKNCIIFYINNSRNKDKLAKLIFDLNQYAFERGCEKAKAKQEAEDKKKQENENLIARIDENLRRIL